MIALQCNDYPAPNQLQAASKLSKQAHHTGQMKQVEVIVRFALVAHGEAPVVLKPGE